MNSMDATARHNEVRAIKDIAYLEVAYDAMTHVVSDLPAEEELTRRSIMQMLRGLAGRMGAQVGVQANVGEEVE